MWCCQMDVTYLSRGERGMIRSGVCVPSKDSVAVCGNGKKGKEAVCQNLHLNPVMVSLFNNTSTDVLNNKLSPHRLPQKVIPDDSELPMWRLVPSWTEPWARGVRSSFTHY